MSDGVARAGGLDSYAERVGRWAAARSTRRSFLGRFGRAAVLLAGGPTVAMLLSRGDVAAARVCGQSGVSPPCPTYDCTATWGWCWYATGCCAGGALKKICDCCAPNTANPHGYCPSGTEVLCIVESCGADPRLQTKRITRVRDTDPVRSSVAASRQRWMGGSAPMAVIGDADDHWFAAMAVSIGRVVEGPTLLTRRAELSPEVAEELARLGTEYVVVAGSLIAATVDAALTARGIPVTRVGVAPDVEGFAAEVARWSRSMTGARHAVVVVPGNEDALAPAAALANAKRWPLLLGRGPVTQSALRDPRLVRTSLVVTRDATDAGAFPGGRAITGTNAMDFAVRLADVAVGEVQVPETTVALAAVGDDVAATSAASMAVPLLRFAPGGLGGCFDWLLAHRQAIDHAIVIATHDDFDDTAYYDLQSVLNEFEAHLLTGEAGDGLPVITQPREERPIGKARR